MTKAQKREVIKRIKAGESRASIAADTGFTKAHLRSIWKNFQLLGQESLKPATRGPKSGGRKAAKVTTPAQKRKIRDLLEKQPKPLSLEAMARMVKAELGITLLRRAFIELTSEWNIPIASNQPNPGAQQAPREEIEGLWKKEKALRKKTNQSLASGDKAEWQLHGMPRGNRRDGPGPQWRKRHEEHQERTYFYLEFWTAGPDTLLTAEIRQLLKKKIYFYSKHLGVEVLSFVIMDSHCFLVVTVPPREKWLKKLRDPQALLQRAQELYHPQQHQRMVKQFATASDQQKIVDYYLRDFCDLSVFVKMIKESVSRAHNRFHNTFGALWMDRFRSLTLTTPRELLQCHLRVNRWPITRGLLTPNELSSYPWSSFGDLLKSSKRSIKATCQVLGIPAAAWKKTYPLDQKKGRKRLARNWFQSQILSTEPAEEHC